MLTGQALIEAIDATRLAPGALAFWWLGQLSYVLRVGDVVLYLDPFLTPLERRKVPPLLAPEQITHAHWVLGTHDHLDHIDPLAFTGIAAASPKTRLVCPRPALQRVLALGIAPERVLALDDGESYVDEKLGLRLTAVAAAHELLDRDPVLGYPYLSYVVEVGGVTIYHSGDTTVYEGMLTKLRRWQFDVMFVPINGRDATRLRRGCIGNMTYQEAVDLVGSLQPRLAVPGHYDMFADNAGDPLAFAEYLEVKYPAQRFWIGAHGERVLLEPAQ